MITPEILTEFKRFNNNIENLIEVLKDSNILIGKYIGYKVTYDEDKKDNGDI